MERDDEPYAVFYKVLEYNGIKENEHSKHRKWFTVLEGILLISLCFDNTFPLIYVIEDHPFNDKAESLQCVTSMLHISAKVIYYRFRGREKLKRLLDDSVKIWKEMRNMKKYEDYLDETWLAINKRVNVITGMFSLCTPIYCLIAFAINLNLDPEDREPLFKIWDPLKYFFKIEDYFFIRMFYEFMMFSYALSTIGTLYLIYLIPSFMAASQIRFLIKMLSSKDLNVTACIEFHQKVLKYVKDINSLFTVHMFFEIILATLVITFRSYQLIMIITNYDHGAVVVSYYLILCFMVPLLVCYSGQMITDASEDLFHWTYQNEWYRLNTKDRKSLCIMMTAASIPLSLCYRNTVTFDMNRYMAVVQATYSYITILINNN
ncbi:odorant receptor 85b-like isoform X1 [Halyomorpha halys]|uniref:odorant receptor 85b-like isoform X1 n=1 Tax=Halyomorpha halys TaxID=286706 RepID=UPI0034D2F25C|nr:Odorant receptor 126 [Halyomorpha halys]